MRKPLIKSSGVVWCARASKYISHEFCRSCECMVKINEDSVECEFDPAMLTGWSR